MAEDNNVTIVAWPKDPAALEHHFAPGEPCPVTISFADTPARVIVSTDPKQPLDVNMNMNVTAREPIPLCIKLCEPICARSDYTIGINIFDNPFASINIRGTTKIANCRDDTQPPPTTERVCVGFDKLQPGTVFEAAFVHEGLTFSPAAGELRAVTFGEPAGHNKLAFAKDGLRIDFPQPVEDVVLTLNNYSAPDLTIRAFAGANLLTQFTVSIHNTVKEITLGQTGVTAVTVSGGSNEAALVEVCYRPMPPAGTILKASG